MSIAAPTATAERLKSAEVFAVSAPPAIAARWGTDAPEITASALLTHQADAAAENARQHAMLGGVLAQDVVVVTGLATGLEGRTADVPYNGRLGLSGVRRVLVTRVRYLPTVGQTELHVLVRL